MVTDKISNCYQSCDTYFIKEISSGTCPLVNSHLFNTFICMYFGNISCLKFLEIKIVFCVYFGVKTAEISCYVTCFAEVMVLQRERVRLTRCHIYTTLTIT